MPEYIALRDTWLSHENRKVLAGDRFETTFPSAGGKPMLLGDNLELVKPEKPEKPEKPKKDGGELETPSV